MIVIAERDPISKVTTATQDLVLVSWQIPMLRTAGVSRADVMLDQKVRWRGDVRLTP
jgi:hypothetical protein